jgi:hypothetical protein
VIEIQLPEPQFSDVTLDYAGAVRGDEDGDDESKKPLRGRVTRNGPFLRKLTREELTADPDNSGLVDLDNHEYYFVCVDIGFVDGAPQLTTARVKLRLASVPAMPAPTAISMHPRADGDKVSVTRTIRIGPRLKILDAVEAEVGGYERVDAYQRTDLYVRAIPDSSSPQWTFTKTSSRKLDGFARLTLVAQAGIGALLEVSGVVTAEAKGRLFSRPYGGDLPRPLELFGAI